MCGEHLNTHDKCTEGLSKETNYIKAMRNPSVKNKSD